MTSDGVDDHTDGFAPNDQPASGPQRFPDDFAALATTIAEHGQELTALANVERIGVGFKVIAGRETHRRCVTVIVTRKLPASELDPADVVPRRFHLHLTDVVESDHGLAES